MALNVAVEDPPPEHVGAAVVNVDMSVHNKPVEFVAENDLPLV